MANYEIVREEEGDKIIKKSGFSFEFSAKAVTDNLAVLDKMTRQLTAQLKLNKAEVENILHFNPFLNDLTEEQKKAAFLFVRSMGNVEMAEEKLAEIAKSREEELEAIREIEEQTGYKIEIPEFKVVITADQLGLKPEEPKAESEEPKPESPESEAK